MTIGNVRSMSTNALSAMYYRRKREGRMPHKMADKAKKLRGLRYSCRQYFTVSPKFTFQLHVTELILIMLNFSIMVVTTNAYSLLDMSMVQA